MSTRGVLLDDDSVALAITPLIRYEVLRGIPWKDPRRLARVRERLNDFDEFETERTVSELAADMFRLDREEHRLDTGYNVEKRRFDAFHVATATVFDLELISDDPHIRRLVELHARLGVFGDADPPGNEGEPA